MLMMSPCVAIVHLAIETFAQERTVTSSSPGALMAQPTDHTSRVPPGTQAARVDTSLAIDNAQPSLNDSELTPLIPPDSGDGSHPARQDHGDTAIEPDVRIVQPHRRVSACDVTDATDQLDVSEAEDAVDDEHLSSVHSNDERGGTVSDEVIESVSASVVARGRSDQQWQQSQPPASSIESLGAGSYTHAPALPAHHVIT